MKKTLRAGTAAALSAVLLLTGCAKTVWKNGEQYRNYNDYDAFGVVDGFCYNTEEGVTRTFLCYMDGSGEPWLCDPSDFYFAAYDPRGKCSVEPGRAYTVTYDVQHRTGGEAGVRESYFLKVDSCVQADIASLFASDLADLNIWNCRNTLPGRCGTLSLAVCGQRGNRFLAVHDGTAYTVYREDGSVQRFDCDRQVSVPFETAEEPGKEKAIGFRVLCGSDVSEERILSALRNGTLAEDSEVFLLGSCCDTHGEPVEYAYECAGVNEHGIQYVRSEYAPEPGFRKVITAEEFAQGITAEEAGLPAGVFGSAEELRNNEKADRSWRSAGTVQAPYQRGILILGGSFTGREKLFMDDSARFILAEDSAAGEDAGFCYAILSVRGEYLSLVPQN